MFGRVESCLSPAMVPARLSILYLAASTALVVADFQVVQLPLDPRLYVSDSACTAAVWYRERLAVHDNNVGCIGGPGGSHFEGHAEGETVKSFTFWPWGGASDGASALTWTLTSGVELHAGKAKKESCSFTFEAGDHIVGDIGLHGNGIGTRLGRIEFNVRRAATGKTESFGCGHEHTRYSFAADGMVITGFTGSSGDDINNLGVLIVDPAKDPAVDTGSLHSQSQYLKNEAEKADVTNPLVKAVLGKGFESFHQDASTVTKKYDASKSESMVAYAQSFIGATDAVKDDIASAIIGGEWMTDGGEVNWNHHTLLYTATGQGSTGSKCNYATFIIRIPKGEPTKRELFLFRQKTTFSLAPDVVFLRRCTTSSGFLGIGKKTTCKNVPKNIPHSLDEASLSILQDYLTAVAVLSIAPDIPSSSASHTFQNASDNLRVGDEPKSAKDDNFRNGSEPKSAKDDNFRVSDEPESTKGDSFRAGGVLKSAKGDNFLV